MQLVLNRPPIETQFFDAGNILSRGWSQWFQSVTNIFKRVLQNNVVAAKAAYAASPGDCVLCDTTSAGFTVTLPKAAMSVNGQIRVLKTSADGNTLTISRSGSDKINGANTQTTASQYGKFTLVSDGVSNWYLF